MSAELISEVMDEAGLGIKVRLTAPVPREDLASVGENWAIEAQRRAQRVWVWVYAGDMDEHGPASSVTYLERGAEPVSTYIPTSTLLLYYLGDGGFGEYSPRDALA